MENSSLKDRIAEKVNELITDPTYFLVDVIITGDGGKKKVLILIDGDQGVNVDECGRISRQLGAYLEEEDLISTAYRLEVSSFGLDYPLMLKRQYIKNIGRKVKVKLAGSSDEPIVGLLEASDEDTIKVLKDGKTKKDPKESITIPFEEILTTNILIQF
ncbi:ribosome maturation factor RimP [Aureibacter tunicatorum]|uniref:Ribosome maturation factor RimP n=1 Tax=Aureibacter tunicatorum TaxID=866807 RepID=A0AAE4BTR4_9BACT|nr:ribosome maturation factor RimP [Aureibacter tunicatorum]MDR6240235.1 ribosome maturation factor RimP [Aureibacter tunicatorum]BDD05884.1 ribosome maturation factor RimP [Aureibacter tunicatorum]